MILWHLGKKKYANSMTLEAPFKGIKNWNIYIFSYSIKWTNDLRMSLTLILCWFMHIEFIPQFSLGNTNKVPFFLYLAICTHAISKHIKWELWHLMLNTWYMMILCMAHITSWVCTGKLLEERSRRTVGISGTGYVKEWKWKIFSRVQRKLKQFQFNFILQFVYMHIAVK